MPDEMPSNRPLPDRVDAIDLEAVRVGAEDSLDDYLDDLERIVNVDSGSGDIPGLEEVADVIVGRLGELGARVERLRHHRWGSTIVGTLEGAAPGPSVLLVGHMDTVFDRGAAGERPFRIEADRVLGPGVCDMKGGLLVGLHALSVLRSTARAGAAASRHEPAWLPVSRLTFIANPDEEVGSSSSAALIEEHARRSDVAIVLEAARANGDIVSARKGQMDVRIDITGRPAHSGVAPEAGRSAVVETAHLILAFDALDGRYGGLTVNAGVIRGGTRPNVVAEHASIELDVRAEEREHLVAVEAEIRAIAASPAVPGVSASVEVTNRQWPMRRTVESMRLVERAIAVAGALGFDLDDAATGGASDANLIAELGVPTIDGLGPVGGDDHTADEYIELDSIAPRIALLAGLLREIGVDR